MTPAEWARIGMYLAAAYPAAPHGSDEATAEVYLDALREFGAHEVQRAAREHVKASRFYPSVAEIQERVCAHRRRLGHDWETVSRALAIEAAGGDPSGYLAGREREIKALDGPPNVALLRQIGADRIGNGGSV